jgi:hypothetical protein
MAREESARRRLMRFVTSAKGAVLTIGALAGAVGAVIALLPKHEHVPSTLKASFSKVTAFPNVDLQEYEERFASHPVAWIDGGGPHTPAALRVPYRLAAATSSATPAKPATPSDPPSASESPSAPSGEAEETPSDTSTSTTPSESTTSTTTTDSGETTDETTTTEESSGSGEEPSAPFKETDGVLARDGNGSDPEAEHAVVEALSEIEVPLQQIAAAKSPEGESTEGESTEGESAQVVVPEACESSSCAVTPMIDNALATDSDPVKAAREVATAFANSRGRVIDNKLYPSGVAVNYTIDLTGWADREARLEWSLWSQTEGRPLPRPWLRNVITKEIKPKVDNGSFAGQFWIPAPPRRGDYVVHLTVYDSDHVEHGEAETEPPFH